MYKMLKIEHYSKVVQLLKKVRNIGSALLRDAINTSFELFKVMIPLSILTRLLAELGLIKYLGFILKPVMELVGLPGDMGLVWAASMVTNIYGGMVVFASLAPEANLTIAQVTVLGTMILVAHSMPLEVSITKKAGTRFRIMITLRIVSALVIGWLLFRIYQFFDVLQSANNAIWNPLPKSPGWIAWLQGEVKNILIIFMVILLLLVLMKILEKLNITALLIRLLKPVLRLLGMSERAAPITIIGMTMGLGYGGGLIIQEAKSGRMEKYDIFYSLSFMGLCHGIIEDTMLMAVIGGHFSGIFWARFIFALTVIFLMVKIINRISEQTFDRFFFNT